MTNVEQYQAFQVEVVRAGFDTTLHIRPDGKGAAKVGLYVELEKRSGEVIGELYTLASRYGFSFELDAESRAVMTLPEG
jgi:hypothetical protein